MRYLITIGALVLAAAALPAAEWSQWRGGPGRSGHLADAAPIFADPPATITLEEVWKVPMPGENYGNYSSAVVAGGRVYAYLNRPQDLEAEKAWKSRERIEAFVCLALADGAVVWRRDFPVERGGRGPHNTPCVVAGKLIGVMNDGTMCCLDAETGADVWQAPLGPDQAKAAELKKAKRRFNRHSSVTVVDDRVIVASYDLAALDLGTGKILWRQDAVHYSAGSPAIWRRGEEAYILGGGRNLWLVDAADGRVAWRLDSRGSGRTTPCIAGDHAVAMRQANKKAGLPKSLVQVIRLDVAEPEVVCEYGHKFVLQSPSTDGHRAYVCTGFGNSIHCLDLPSGEKLWSCRSVGDHYSSPLLVGGTLISWSAPHRKPMGEGESKLAFYRADTGAEIAVCNVTRLGECVFPAVAGDRIVFRGLESLWCYRAR